MKKILTGILLASLATLAIAKDIDINKAKGTEQSVIVSLTPAPANMDVDQDVVLEAVLDVELDAKHVQKNNVKLKYITQTKESMIDGEVAYIESEQAVTFTPSKLLEEGYYEVEFKSLKAIKSNKEEQIKEIKYMFYVPEVINGHKLPPEPDETLNNSTLLGIDVNENDVRDDVERWIYITYKDKHPVYVDIALQAGRVSNKILENLFVGDIEAKDIHKSEIAVVACEAYYKYDAKYFNEPILVKEQISTGYFEKLYFNTKERENIYNSYAELLSGDSYTIPRSEERKSLCDFNTVPYEK